jgi:hypothetical protein
MPGPEDILRSFVQRQQQRDDMSPGSVFDGDPLVPPGSFLDDEGNLWPEPEDITRQQGDPLRPGSIPVQTVREMAANYGVAPESVRDMNTELYPLENRRSIFNPEAIKETYTRARENPRRVKQELIAETLGRFDQIPNFAFDQELQRREAPRVAGEVLAQAKSEGLDPRGSWRDATTSQTLADARDLLANTKGNLYDLQRTRVEPFLYGVKNVKKNIGSSVNKFIEGIKYPGFIANPLALRNPVVEAGGLIKEGSLVNPQAVKFLKEFAPKEEGRYTTFQSPFGTSVDLAADLKKNTYDLAFQGPFGYRMPSSIKKQINQDLERAAYLEAEGDLDVANNLRDKAMNMQEMLNEPLRSPALRYTLGDALGSVPVGSSVTASPIGREKGARARIYSALTNNALATLKGVTPDPELMPTEEEFRQAREGGGFTRDEVDRINRNRGVIRSERTGPTTWRNVNQQEKTFDPSTLKDEMIRATYNLPVDTDVSSLRYNPLGLFQQTNRIDFTKPVITPESPIYKFRKGLKGGIGIGAADLIPSPEAVRDLYAGQPLSALQRTGQNIVQSLPLAAAVGGTVAAAPVLAPLAGAAGTALTLNTLGAAGNEVVRQQTGEDIVSKLRQAIGTAPRTGIASRSQPTRPYVQPRLVQTKPVNPVVQQMQNRLGLAQSRFNPARGEFGLSEILFGR